MRQLKGLRYPVEYYDLIFVHAIHNKLDPETSKAWELCRYSEQPSIHEMLKFLDTQAKAMMGVQFAETRSGHETKKRGFYKNERKPNTKSISSEHSNKKND